MSRVFWRSVQVLAALFVACTCIAYTVGMFQDVEAGRGGGSSIYALIGFAIGAIVFAGATAKLAPPDPMVCRRCGYHLTGLPREAVCPECGTPRPATEPGDVFDADVDV